MALDVRSSSSAAGYASSYTFTQPTGLTAGDLMIMQVSLRGERTISAPTGWSVIGSENRTISEVFTSMLCSRTATSDDVSSWSHSINWGGSEEYGCAITAIQDHDGVDTSNGQTTSSSSTITAATVTPSNADSLLLFFCAHGADRSIASYSITTSDPGGWTEEYEVGTPVGNDMTISMAYDIRTETTATGSGTASSSLARPNCGHLVVIAPASGAEYEAAVSPVTTSFTVPAVTATFEAEYSASVSPVTTALAVPAVTATYASELSAALSPATAELSVPAVTAQGEIAYSASASPVATTFSVPSVTATYQSELSAAVAPVAITPAIPAVTATYESELTAAVTPVTATLTVPAVTATTAAEYSAVVVPVATTLAVPAVTATYESELSASVSPVAITPGIPAVTATHESVLSAAVAPVTASFSIPAVTATGSVSTEYEAAVVPVGITAAIPAVTATYALELTAAVTPVGLTFGTGTAPEITFDPFTGKISTRTGGNLGF